MRMSWPTESEVHWRASKGVELPEPVMRDGFSIIEVSSREEAVEWVKKWPRSCVPSAGQALELRQVYSPEDFAEALTPELFAREELMREEAARNAARG